MEPTKDFEELFALFADEGVEFVVIGAYAMAFHELPRYTKDIDILVRADATNARRIVRALDAFGFAASGLSDADFATPGRTVQLGVEPTRIDIWTEIDGVSFDAAWSDREEGSYGSVRVPFISRANLILNKRASGRKQDLADLERLERT